MMIQKMFDKDDLLDKRSWLETLSKWIEWEYPLEYSIAIEKVVEIINILISEIPSTEIQED